jgi:hypothetical protein
MFIKERFDLPPRAMYQSSQGVGESKEDGLRETSIEWFFMVLRLPLETYWTP